MKTFKVKIKGHIIVRARSKASAIRRFKGMLFSEGRMFIVELKNS